jgi:hypothetical protein
MHLSPQVMRGLTQPPDAPAVGAAPAVALAPPVGELAPPAVDPLPEAFELVPAFATGAAPALPSGFVPPVGAGGLSLTLEQAAALASAAQKSAMAPRWMVRRMQRK